MSERESLRTAPSSTDPGLMERVNHRGWRGCPGYQRHWYSVEGLVGLRTPRCTRCGFPRPGSDLTSDDWQQLRSVDWRGLTDEEKAWIDRNNEEGWS